MLFFIIAVYIISVLCKAFAIMYALRAWCLLSKDFASPSAKPTRIASSQAERVFQSTMLGTMGNILFIPAFLAYIMLHGGYTLGWVEMLFVGGHLFDSLYSLSTHHHTRS
jgi:hypothetical protein